MSQTPLDNALISLKELYPSAIELSLDRLYRLLGRLGNPQDHTPPVIHVAGTNGKGSTIACLRAVMEAAGYKCHVYTSPHLLKFNERIRLAGEVISDEYLIGMIEEVKRVNDGEPISFFEITTAVAFLAFSRVPADVVLLEVGMGGLNDATNVVRHPFMTVITTISYDHVDWLGRTLPEIARQKAGIMKPGVPCIVGHQLDWARDEVMPVFERQAKALGAPLIKSAENVMLHYPRPSLPGAHQLWNAGTAITLLKNQTSFMITDDHIAAGLSQAEWPARLERITTGTVAAMLPPGWELWYDGAHNDSCGQVLGDHARAWRQESGMPLHLVTGMLKSKNPRVCLGPVLPYIQSLTTFSFQSGPYDLTGLPYGADELAAALGDQTPVARSAPSLKQAVSDVMAREPAGRILVTGTLYAYKDLF